MATRPSFVRGKGRGRGAKGTAPPPSTAAPPGGEPMNWAKKASPASPANQPRVGVSVVQPNAKQGKQAVSSSVSAEERFQDAASRHQVALHRHMQDVDCEYESSSSEDEMNGDGIMTAVFKLYTASTGGGEGSSQINDYVSNSVKSKANTCLICIETVKRADPVWSCCGCYTLMHITCIQQWVRDGVYQRTALSDEHFPDHKQPWLCPKCRYEYAPEQCPTRYLCYCGALQDPPCDPWLVPHSCGEACGRPLRPACGHRCLLLCHPGPCPPCPQTVAASCFCRRRAAVSRRCGDAEWSCGERCQRPLACHQHNCQAKCHKGECPVCPETSRQTCQCGRQTCQRPCASPQWQCERVCLKELSCGQHVCQLVCHAGDCGPCPRSGERPCPCGRTSVSLPCTEDVPTCQETCGRRLECGLHTCTQRCHNGPCATCRQMSVKRCRCGQKKREVPCFKPYLCDNKCSQMRDCGRHGCKRKCCDGACPDCDLPCGRSLPCRNHKCASRCHRGPCYPCPLTVTLSCACGQTSVTVPCGAERRTKPPRCKAICKKPAACHHASQTRHRCHPGRCPPCPQTCGRTLPHCQHNCPAQCHSAVLTRVQAMVQRSGPWEAVPEAELRVVSQPCPPCLVPVPVHCYGQHQTDALPCDGATEFSCHRRCGRMLSCSNHECQRECHVVDDAPDHLHAGDGCTACELACALPRACEHACMLACHGAPCPPCTLPVRMRCHCALSVRHVDCAHWACATRGERDALKACGGACPHSLACGHRCKASCHAPPCPDGARCADKVTVRCACRRRKKHFACDEVRAGNAKVICDDLCQTEKEAKLKRESDERREKREKEEAAQREECEQFSRKMKRPRPRRQRAAAPAAPPPSPLLTPLRGGALLAALLALFTLYLVWWPV